jgi:hypothetical protein
MNLSREVSIAKLWFSTTDASLINLVQYTWSFTADSCPGVTSDHGGLIDISPSRLSRGASNAEISEAIDEFMDNQMNDLLSFHEHQLSFQYLVKSSTEHKVAAPTSAEIDAERDRRIDAGFYFEGTFYQCRPEDRENIAGAKSAASDAITVFGAQPGNLAWRRLLDPTGPAEFRWIAADNSTVPMDAQTAMRFGYAALSHKEAHIFAGFLLKQSSPPPEDFATNPAYWPQSGS